MMPDFIPPTAEQAAEQQKMMRQAAEQHRMAQVQDAELGIEARRQLLRFAAVMCTCSPRYAADDSAPYHGCVVHGQMMLHYETGQVITWP